MARCFLPISRTSCIFCIWGAGTAHYSLGVIFTKMGKPDKAVRHLIEARNLGFPVVLSGIKYDIVWCIPEFDALADTIWPEVKD